MKMKIQELLTQRNLLINLTKTAKGKRKKEMNGQGYKEGNLSPLMLD